MAKQRLPSIQERRAEETQRQLEQQQLRQVQQQENVSRANELLQQRETLIKTAASKVRRWQQEETRINSEFDIAAAKRRATKENAKSMPPNQRNIQNRLADEQYQRDVKPLQERNRILKNERSKSLSKRQEITERIKSLSLSPSSKAELTTALSTQGRFLSQTQRAEALKEVGARQTKALKVAGHKRFVGELPEDTIVIGEKISKGKTERILQRVDKSGTPIGKTFVERRPSGKLTTQQIVRTQLQTGAEEPFRVKPQTRKVGEELTFTEELSQRGLSKADQIALFQQVEQIKGASVGFPDSKADIKILTSEQLEARQKKQREPLIIRPVGISKTDDVVLGTQKVEVSKDATRVTRTEILTDPAFFKKDADIPEGFFREGKLLKRVTTTEAEEGKIFDVSKIKTDKDIIGTQTITDTGAFLVATRAGFKFESDKEILGIPIPKSIPKKTKASFKTPEAQIQFEHDLTDKELLSVVKSSKAAPGGVIGIVEGGLTGITAVATGDDPFKEAIFAFKERSLESAVRKAQLQEAKARGEPTFIPTVKAVATDVGEFGLLVGGAGATRFVSKKLAKVTAGRISEKAAEKVIIGGATTFLGAEALKDPSLRKVSLVTAPIIISQVAKGGTKIRPRITETVRTTREVLGFDPITLKEPIKLTKTKLKDTAIPTKEFSDILVEKGIIDPIIFEQQVKLRSGEKVAAKVLFGTEAKAKISITEKSIIPKDVLIQHELRHLEFPFHKEGAIRTIEEVPFTFGDIAKIKRGKKIAKIVRPVELIIGKNIQPFKKPPKISKAKIDKIPFDIRTQERVKTTDEPFIDFTKKADDFKVRQKELQQLGIGETKIDIQAKIETEFFDITKFAVKDIRAIKTKGKVGGIQVETKGAGQSLITREDVTQLRDVFGQPQEVKGLPASTATGFDVTVKQSLIQRAGEGAIRQETLSSFQARKKALTQQRDIFGRVSTKTLRETGGEAILTIGEESLLVQLGTGKRIGKVKGEQLIFDPIKASQVGEGIVSEKGITIGKTATKISGKDIFGDLIVTPTKDEGIFQALSSAKRRTRRGTVESDLGLSRVEVTDLTRPQVDDIGITFKARKKGRMKPFDIIEVEGDEVISGAFKLKTKKAFRRPSEQIDFGDIALIATQEKVKPVTLPKVKPIQKQSLKFLTGTKLLQKDIFKLETQRLTQKSIFKLDQRQRNIFAQEQIFKTKQKQDQIFDLKQQQRQATDVFVPTVPVTPTPTEIFKPPVTPTTGVPFLPFGFVPSLDFGVGIKGGKKGKKIFKRTPSFTAIVLGFKAKGKGLKKKEEKRLFAGFETRPVLDTKGFSRGKSIKKIMFGVKPSASTKRTRRILFGKETAQWGKIIKPKKKGRKK